MTGRSWASPSVFEMQPGRCKWIYQTDDREIEISVQCLQDAAATTLKMVVTQGPPCEFLVSHRLVLGGSEGEDHGSVEILDDGVSACLKPAKDTFVSQHLSHPGFLVSGIDPNTVMSVGSDEMLYPDADAIHV